MIAPFVSLIYLAIIVLFIISWHYCPLKMDKVKS